MTNFDNCQFKPIPQQEIRLRIKTFYNNWRLKRISIILNLALKVLSNDKKGGRVGYQLTGIG